MDGQMLAYTTILLPYKDPENKFQNIKEFSGGILGCILASIVLKPSSLLRIHWIGDNTSALTWAENNKYSSKAAQYANIAYTWFQVYSQVHLHNTEHCAGIHMGNIDGLSRDLPTPGLDPRLRVDLDSHGVVQELFRAIDPTTQRNLDDHHMTFKHIHTLLRQFS
jgi:hypothetical protein